MEKNIATQNAGRLSNLSIAFFLINQLPFDEELIHVFSQAIMAGVGKWYTENKGRNINPETEIICEDAIKYAFTRAQEISNLATICAQTGIGMEM